MKGLKEPDTIDSVLSNRSARSTMSTRIEAILKTAVLKGVAGFAEKIQSVSDEVMRGLAVPSLANTLLALRSSIQASRCALIQGRIGIEAAVHTTKTGQYSQAVSSQKVELPVAPKVPIIACQ